jgi:hypothetical protein
VHRCTGAELFRCAGAKQRCSGAEMKRCRRQGSDKVQR